MRRYLFPALLLAISAVPLTACGVDFGESDENHEPLASIRVVGTPVAGEELRLELAYSQPYAVAVDVECRVKQTGKVLQTIGEATVPANPTLSSDDDPQATPVDGVLDFTFRIDKPGEYVLECITPADDDNYLRRAITVSP